jgi:peptidoglycan-associated lipoprotein
MKRALFFRVLVLGVVVAIGAVGCKKTPKSPTPIPPGQRGAVTGEGPGGIKEGGASPAPVVPAETTPKGSETGPGTTPGGELPEREGFEGYTENRDAFKAQTVYFDFDSSVVNRSEQGKLAAVAEALKANPKNKLRIEGHCDERGTEGYNMALGERRALALREYLMNLGLSGKRLQTVSFGESRPAVQGHDESAWKMNRRGEFVLLTP